MNGDTTPLFSINERCLILVFRNRQLKQNPGRLLGLSRVISTEGKTNRNGSYNKDLGEVFNY